MSANETLSKIPVIEEHVPGATTLGPARRYMQIATLILLVLIPASGLFRIDVAAGGVLMWDRLVWFSDMFIIMGFWIFIASLLVMMYSLVGSVFCGWMCPQNTVSEWANNLTDRLLGRRAKMMDTTGTRMQIAVRRKSLLNYLILGSLLFGASLVYALIPMFYFYSPQAIWSFVSFQYDEELAGGLHWIYMVCVFVMLIDIVAIRHLMCKYMCIYRVWQHSFKTRDTLHVSYDASRSDHCSNCNYCVDSCFLDIDPRQPEVFDSCVNCGACVVACDELHSKSKKLQGPGLLRLSFGDEWKGKYRGALGSFFSRARAATLATLIGAGMFAYGIVSYEPASFSVYRGEAQQGDQLLDYRINIAYKVNHPEQMHIRVEGLDDSQYSLEKDAVQFESAGRQDVVLYVRDGLPEGLYRFWVVVTADDGWTKKFQVVHFAKSQSPTSL
ncbi:MAG: ferredoxin [Zetaproteobacteria bacterium CG12_big_fil_rev_8_21_14_0_65_55_1124]|nr:MAG: ferredoxin [Zetaproteobacteria bacterium CG1_02_55_237]PIS20315.1 MAG: ferredoxin [Zetaproteobacteria bacterium CG08_land_8_20_14_0_20_55_17]PIW42458.1 MAG: ferredoxin [Zetaproteobacteria bacterium CG12_big_fil_rev_8_21_14_0_65_55_1124]PIY52317.1 MAG: ferredoxin [Zetaproteobacteria bacterium CG_4_10_14_0_8_um_filter_55_43]PIZ37096.1 MAG: ferredoxin [Zetaproteobacteria bacterium CG_4_10_14_0_2_um_filter_55_20]PJB81816.1 MAG: ferredoxin [Zetaproteobacteria bacterium CG_4_9_14_0_8_um_filt